MEPNRERVKLWLDALVSGEYGQGRETLRPGENEWCCLGVAVDVANRNGAPYDARIEGTGKNSGHFPTQDTIGWYGMDFVHYRFNIPNKSETHEWIETYGPAGLNDACGWSFQQIAEAFAKKLDIEITYPPEIGRAHV